MDGDDVPDDRGRGPPLADDARDRWQRDRTTFQRVYDVIVGATDPATASEIADRAACSENGAREALDQLVEMGIARRSTGRPATYRRNESYLRWKRIESIASEHRAGEIRERLDDLLAEDRAYQDEFGVPDPDVVDVADPTAGHDAVQDRWDDVTTWRTVRRDIGVLQRALRRAESRGDDLAEV